MTANRFISLLLADYTNEYQQQLKSVAVTLKVLEILMKDANPDGLIPGYDY